MTPALLFPLGLAALAAWVVPLVLHLRRRSEQRPIDFAALRWLSPRPRPRHRVRFDEWPLLLVRLMLLALLAVLIARPVLYGADRGEGRVLVMPGVDPGRARAMAGDARAQWLAPGFPTLDTPPPRDTKAGWSLLREFEAELPRRAALTVVVPAVLQGAEAERIRLTRRVHWAIVPGEMAAGRAPAAVAPALVLAGDGVGGRYLRAVAQAWGSAGRRERVTAWLVPGPLPASVREAVARGGVLLAGSAVTLPGPAVVVWRDAAGLPLAERGAIGRGRFVRFVRPLTPAVMPELVEPDFPDRLRVMLAGPSPEPARVAAVAYRPLTGARRLPPPARDAGPIVALAAALLFVVERWLATGRRRGTSA